MSTRSREGDKRARLFSRCVLPLSQGFALGLRRCLKFQAARGIRPCYLTQRLCERSLFLCIRSRAYAKRGSRCRSIGGGFEDRNFRRQAGLVSEIRASNAYLERTLSYPV